MTLKTITLKNFKAYSELEFHCNENFNIIVGANNIGKSTIFDALLLWNLAYSKLITKDKKKFFKKTSYNNMKINFTQFSIFRLINTSDLFNNPNKEAVIGLIIKDSEDYEYNLEITLNKPDLENSYIRFTNNYEEFKRFSECCNNQNIRLPEAIKIKITKPISSLLKEEPFCNKAQIKNKTYLGFSNEVLRNKILTVMEYKKFEYLQGKLSNILNKSYTLRFKNDNRDDKEFIDMTIEEDGRKEVNLLLVGSGVLHILEIFSTIKNQQSNNIGVQLLLLDEPDAHIHADIQVKLIDELKLEENLQTFMITHNDRLINKAEDGELFYINQETVNNKLLEPLAIEAYEVVSEELCTLFDNNSDKPIILTEGKTDKKILTIAWEKLNPDIEIPYYIISPGTDTIDEERMTSSANGVREALMYASTFVDKKIIGLFDNDSEGRRRFKGLKDNIFEGYISSEITRKHKSKEIWGLCLPIPEFRSAFVTENSIEDSYLTIEHYFNNDILDEFSMKGSNILSSEVFRIQGNKNNFADNIQGRNRDIFLNFQILFDKIEEIIN